MDAGHERASGQTVKALFIGAQTRGTTSQLRAQALCDLLPSHAWNLIDSDLIFLRAPRWQRSLWFRLRTGPAVAAMNRLVLSQLGTEPYEIAWIDKGVWLWPDTISQIRQLARRMVYYTPDTSFLANKSRFFDATMALYDLIVTTKSLELTEFKKRSPRAQIELVTQAYDATLHSPRCTFAEKRKEAVLIGLCEPDRERCIEQLLEHEIAVRIGGFGWQKFLRRHVGNRRLQFAGEKIFDRRYAETLSLGAVGLGLMTQRFPELHTTRTFEIPACGTALATVRNSETSKFFGEEEAIFFTDHADLARRVVALMNDDVQLKAITEAGTRRVKAGAYSNRQVLTHVLERVGIDCHDSELLASGIPHATASALDNPLGFDSDRITQDVAQNHGRISLGKKWMVPDVVPTAHTASVVAPASAPTHYSIGYLGADWWGSDARALAVELRGRGHLLVDRHYEDYFCTKWKSFTLRAVRRLLRRRMAAEYNQAVEQLLDIQGLDFLLAFKGMLLSPKTLKKFKDAGTPCYCIYPDVSYHDHGSNIWKCLPLYDCLFTTKSFHLEDPLLLRRAQRVKFVPHGFDPEVHRPLILPQDLAKYYGSDVSFVGVWTQKKEHTLAALIAAMPDICLKIWGPFWNHAEPSVRKHWQGRSAYGDELSAICSCSAINLGLLSASGTGTTKGDQTTARTWQIPGCGGFMLHEDTEELRNAFVVGEHVDVFGSHRELLAKIRRYLAEPELRERIRRAGYEHCLNSRYTYQTAADRILSFHESNSATL